MEQEHLLQVLAHALFVNFFFFFFFLLVLFISATLMGKGEVAELHGCRQLYN